MKKSLAVLAVVFALALAASACRAPQSSSRAAVTSKPGWGRGFSMAERELTVRAVPASAVPSVPETRLGRPGWGSAMPVR